MENFQKRHLELMQEKLDVMRQILQATTAVSFAGTRLDVEKDVEAFASLYAARADMIEKVQKIDAAIGLLQAPDDAKFKKTAEALTNEMRRIAEEFMRLDRANIVAYEMIMGHLKGDMQQTKHTRQLNNIYLDVNDHASGQLFDKKN